MPNECLLVDDPVADVPLKSRTNHNFEYSNSPRPISSSPPYPRVKDVDLDLFFKNEDLNLDDINSLMALSILNLFITKSMVDSSSPPEVSMEKEEEYHSPETPLSPKTRRVSDVPRILDTKGTKQSSGHQSSKSKRNGTLCRRFSLKSTPSLTLTQFLERLNHYCGFSTAVYLATTLYIHKLTVQKSIIKLDKLNVHRLVIAALRISCKTLEDMNYKQPFIAKICGVNKDDLLFLEITFLFLIEFDCQVNYSSLTELVKNVRELYQQTH